MDFIFLSSIAKMTLPMITISYDIACQWHKNFLTRMKDMPLNLQIPPHDQLRYCVPNFHLPAHTERCHAPYSFNYMKWVGRTDGEGVERNWSSLNGAARCVAIMTPGGRQDTLDDFCNFSNWRKTEHSDKLTEWEDQIQAWELDKSKPCPYELPQNEVTLADVKQQLAEEEHQKVENGEGSTAELSPSGFVILGLEIEEYQYVASNRPLFVLFKS
ncbi:hypothetical protein BD779DRAFT_1458501 [Infundibulicybe gibba]|nr:hypothetical protein BD779DRAFT_1458501 [Infundibulicybe gibba]